MSHLLWDIAQKYQLKKHLECMWRRFICYFRGICWKDRGQAGLSGDVMLEDAICVLSTYLISTDRQASAWHPFTALLRLENAYSCSDLLLPGWGKGVWMVMAFFTPLLKSARAVSNSPAPCLGLASAGGHGIFLPQPGSSGHAQTGHSPAASLKIMGTPRQDIFLLSFTSPWMCPVPYTLQWLC